MKNVLLSIGLLYSFHTVASAQPSSIQDFDKLMDFGETAHADLLAPPTTTNQVEALGSTWFYRDYGYLSPIQGGTGLAVAVNISGGGGINPGDVYVIGGVYGTAPVLVDTLSNLLTLVPDSPVQGGDSRIIDPGNDNCIPVRFPLAGTQASYERQIAVFDQDLMPTGEFSISEQHTLWVDVLSSQVTTRIETMIVGENYEQTTVNDTTQFWELAENLRFQTRLESNLVTNITIPNVKDEVQETVSVTVYDSPGMLEGPADELCEGLIFYSAPTAGSIMTTIHINEELFNEVDGPTTSVAFTTEVNSVDKEISTPAGIFETVEVTASNDAGMSINWLDVDTGLPVVTEVYDSAGNLTSVTTLQEVTN